MEAAAREFAEKGYDDATVRDVCRRAKANVAAVNYHFGGKAALHVEAAVAIALPLAWGLLAGPAGSAAALVVLCLVAATGAVPARDYYATLGFDATEGEAERATWRVMLSRERVRSRTAAVVPFVENQLILQRRTSF